MQSSPLPKNAYRFPSKITMSPTQRSLKLLREEGYTVAITERWNPWSRTRQDLFGFIDLLCFKDNVVLAVQTTDGTSVAKRIAKIRATQAFPLWLNMPTRQVEVHGWLKRGPRGKRKVWTCRRVRLWELLEQEL